MFEKPMYTVVPNSAFLVKEEDEKVACLSMAGARGYDPSLTTADAIRVGTRTLDSIKANTRCLMMLQLADLESALAKYKAPELHVPSTPTSDAPKQKLSSTTPSGSEQEDEESDEQKDEEMIP